MTVTDQIAAVYEAESRKVLATLVRLLGDLDLAEEALQEAFGAAAERWPKEGVPANPRAWLVSTGRFKGIDVLRRRGRGDALLRELATDEPPAEGPEDQLEPWAFVQDDQLRLVFLCCHPALPVEGRVALSLREVCGLRTDEIARCFLVTPDAMKRRISRAKAVLRDERVPYEIPSGADLRERLAAVLHVVYLVFNEGYAATSGERHIRDDLTREALYLSRLLADLMPEPEALGLQALMQLHESRRAARLDAEGNIVPLEDQDRSRWDQALIAEAQQQLQRAVMSGRIGPFTIQALIAATHAAAPSVEATNWALIVESYDMLATVMPSPVVALQRAVAVAMRDGPEAGLPLVEALIEGELAEYHSAHAVHADLARRLGQLEVAAGAYRRAIALTRQGPEERYLRRRLEEISK